MKDFHPTKKLLVTTAVNLLDTKAPSEISVDEILETSGVSKGSLYHHFVDLEDLLIAAQVTRYARYVDLSIEMMTPMLSTAKNPTALYEALCSATATTQAKSRMQVRVDRARAISSAATNPKFAEALGREQDRLTGALTDLVQEVINKGLFKPDLDAKAIATFIQTYTLGIIIDDLNPHPLEADAWVEIINRVIHDTFINFEN